jgi:hypothetical protein
MRRLLWPGLVLTALLAAGAIAGAEDFPFSRFERASLNAIVGDWNASEASQPDTGGQATVIVADIQSNVVRAVYRGGHRAVDSRTTDFLRDFQKAVPSVRNLADLYREEYRFSDGRTDYWLPVQAPVAAFFDKAMKPGDPVDLYVIAAGGYRGGEGWHWILPVEEFQAVTPSKGG